MSDAYEPGDESDTEVLPAVDSGSGVPRTKELPVVQAETVVTPPPAQAETVVTAPPVQAERVVTPPPVRAPASPAPAPAPVQAETVVTAPPVQPPARPAPAPVQPRPVPPRTRRGYGWRNAFLALVAVLVLVGAVAVVARDRFGTAGPGRGGSSTAVAVSATISSFDPSGGSGFQQQSGSTWRTQTYQSAQFGNLKDGVGLLIDLGSARQVATVTFDAVGGPIAVELRAGDDRASSAGGYRTVATDGSASGPTSLAPKNAGKHRYWLVWVTRLAPQNGGYRAVISNPVVKAQAS